MAENATTTTTTQATEGQTQQTTTEQTASTGGQTTTANATGTQQTSQTADWRSSITDENARKFAESSTDLNHLVGRALTMQQKLSGAIVRPGKDAKPEDVAAYRKALDIPDDPKGYEFTRPEFMPEEAFRSEGTQAVIGAVAKAMHEAGASKAVVKTAWEMWSKLEGASMLAAKAADEKFVKDSDAELAKLWPGDELVKNKTLGSRALKDMAQKAGIDADSFLKIETREGRFLADDPRIVRLFAHLGRESSEGTLHGAVTDGERAGLDSQISASRAKQAELQAQGKHREANAEYQNEMGLIAKKDGNRGVVGARGRAA